MKPLVLLSSSPRMGFVPFLSARLGTRPYDRALGPVEVGSRREEGQPVRPQAKSEWMKALKPLDRSFYGRNTRIVAYELMGKILTFRNGRTVLRGRIVETEAYLGSEDPASHAYRGVTPRNRVMFGPPGFSYVYFTYGNHHCFNIVTEPEGVPGAVLIRAVEPLTGILVMRKRRGEVTTEQLANGPGKLTQAFGITRDHSGHDMTAEPFYVAQAYEHKDLFSGAIHIQATTRIGIRRGKKMLFRFYLMGSPFVSVG